MCSIFALTLNRWFFLDVQNQFLDLVHCVCMAGTELAVNRISILWTTVCCLLLQQHYSHWLPINCCSAIWNNCHHCHHLGACDVSSNCMLRPTSMLQFDVEFGVCLCIHKLQGIGWLIWILIPERGVLHLFFSLMFNLKFVYAFTMCRGQRLIIFPS